MTVTTNTTPTPAEVLAADNRAQMAPTLGPTGPSSEAVAFLRSWAEGLSIIGQTMGPLIWTDIVPLHHWPMPPGETLSSFANPRMKHPREDDESYSRRQAGAAASATAVAMRGATLGIDPFVALADMWNIRGKLGMSTKLRNSLARGRGIRTWDEELTAESVTCAGIDPVSGQTVRVTITMTDAERAGWVKQNDNYRRNPVDMLWSRAMSRVLDRVAGHVLAGVASVEDLRDEPDPAVAAARPATVTVEDLAARAAVAPAAGPDGDEPADPAPPAPAPDPAVKMIDEKTWRAINREWTRLGVTGPGSNDRRFGAIVRMIARPITGGSELTAVEADLVLDTLKGLPADRLDLLAELLGEDVPEPAEDVPPAAAPATEEPPGWQE